jgi:uncharacterized protein
MNKILLGTLLFSPLLARRPPVLRVRQGESAAETLICKDAGLAALDNELSALYPKAIAGFSPSSEERARHPARLDQGRNDCWKAGDLRQCVEESCSCGSPSCR